MGGSSSSLRVDRDRNVIDVMIAGFWGAEDALAFVKTLEHEVDALGPLAGKHAIVFDLSEALVSPTETITMIGLMLAGDSYKAARARRIAVHASSALVRMQMGRLIGMRGGMQVFDDLKLAREWALEVEAVERV